VAEPIRFYMDQHYPASVTQGLRRLGIDVLAQNFLRGHLPGPGAAHFAAAPEGFHDARLPSMAH
jgi:hypothetical protein